MQLWCEDFSTFSLDEVFQRQVENRLWSKELRRKNNALVNSRLANEITLVDYQVERKLVGEETAECRRRASMLEAQIILRTGRPLVPALLS
jgi:hypothetical protein